MIEKINLVKEIIIITNLKPSILLLTEKKVKGKCMVWMFIIDLFGGQKKIKKILTIYDWQWWCIFSFLVFSLSICVACVEVTQPSIEKFSSGIQLIIRDEMKTRFVFVIVQSMVSWFCVYIIYIVIISVEKYEIHHLIE